MRPTAVSLVAAATAAASLIVLSTGAGTPSAGQGAALDDAGASATGFSAPVRRPPGDLAGLAIRRCPTASDVPPPGTATALAVRASALRFVHALLAGEPEVARALSEPPFAPRAARLARRGVPVDRMLRAGPVLPAASSPYGAEIAAECGGDVARASWVVGVRIANAPTGPRVVLIARRAGWRVWAMS